MPRLLIACLLSVAGPLCSAAPKRTAIHRQIAGYAAAISTNLLAQDIEDEHGLLLLRFARALRPKNDAALLTMAMLERGKKPDPVETKVTAAKLYSVIAGQASALRQKEWPKNTKAGQLALLYYRLAERVRPDDRKIMLGLMKLRVRGVDGDLNQALEQTGDLKDVFGNPEKPAPIPKQELAEVDRNIAKYAAIWGTNRLAADPDDAKGLALLRLAAWLAPENSNVLLSLALLERQKTPDPLKSEVTEERLLDVIVGRAGKLLARELKTTKDAGLLSLVYFRVAERFRPEEEKVLLALMKLEADEIEGKLDDLLLRGPSLGALESPARPRPTDGGLSPPGSGEPWTIDALGMELLFVEAGAFMMGSPTNEDHREESEQQHQVTITRPFWLGKCEVTQAQYEQVMGENPSRHRGTKLPVEMVSWHRATGFCVRLSKRERKAGRVPKGYAYRLPTEAEREYSYRAGTQTPYFFGRNLGRAKDYGWYSDNNNRLTREVGLKKPNAWGFHDMLGNVWEWCSDWLIDYSDGPATDPWGANTGGRRAYRGGGHSFPGYYGRAAARSGGSHGQRFVGFRLALVYAPAPGKPGQRPWPRLPVKRASRPKFTPPSKWVAFAAKRDRLPVEKQISLIADELKKYNDGKAPNFKPEIREGELTRISLANNSNLRSLWPLFGMELNYLDLIDCTSLKGDLAALTGMKLTSLAIRGCTGLTSLRGIEEADLRWLGLQGTTALKDIKALRGMQMEHLSISSCGALKNINALRGMPLERISIWTSAVTSIEALRGMPLKSLTLGNLKAFDGNLRPLEGMPLGDLRLLSFYGGSLVPVKGLPLTNLSIAKSDITSLAPLKGMKLTTLSLSSCNQLDSLKELADMPLASVTVSNCGAVEDGEYKIFEKMPTLTKVHTGDTGRDLRIMKAVKELRDKLAREER